MVMPGIDCGYSSRATRCAARSRVSQPSHNVGASGPRRVNRAHSASRSFRARPSAAIGDEVCPVCAGTRDAPDNTGMPTPRRGVRRPNAPALRRLPAWADRVPGPQDTLPDQVEQFLDWLRVQRNRPATTVRAYRQVLAQFVAFLRTPPLGDSFSARPDRTL